MSDLDCELKILPVSSHFLGTVSTILLILLLNRNPKYCFKQTALLNISYTQIATMYMTEFATNIGQIRQR